MAYRHQPLRSSRATRLVELERSNDFNATIRCRLLEVPLDHCPPYEALSYSWEAQIPTKPIVCFDRSWNVTENCEAALHHLRLPDRPRLLWIDSICIDQSSIQERNQQIAMMEEIYARAVEVIVWLGIGTGLSNTAMRNLLKQSKNPDWTNVEFGANENSVVRSMMWQSCFTSLMWCIVRPMVLFRGLESSRKGTSPISLEGYGGAYFDLFSRSVFERMWCVQEIAVARQVRLICGGESLTWDELISAIEYLSRLLELVMETTVVVKTFKERLALQKELREIMRSSGSAWNENSRAWPTLATLITCTRNRGAKDPRDKVFALAGLFKRMGVGLPPSDYSKPVRQVYQEITHSTILQFRMLDILYQVSGLENQFDLPSWVPDLSDTRPPRLMIHDAFKATASSPAYYRFSDKKPSLILWGKIIGQINRCGDPVLFCAPPSESALSLTTEIDSVLRVFKQWSTIAHSLCFYPNHQPIPKAFARTLLNIGTFSESCNPSDFLGLFPTWHNLMTSAQSGHDMLNESSKNMISDIQKTAATANEKLELALQMVAATLEAGVLTKVRKKKRAKTLHTWLAITMRRRLFFTTENGYMGISAYSTREKDFIALLAGLSVPFVVRRIGGEYRLVAPAYVHGVMEGELWDERVKLDEFVFN